MLLSSVLSLSVSQACAPSLKDLGPANVDVPLGVDYLPLLEQDRGHMTGLGEEDRDHLFGSAYRSLEFHRWALTWENQTEDCCLLSFSYWYAKVSLPVTMSQTRSDLPPSHFQST